MCGRENTSHSQRCSSRMILIEPDDEETWKHRPSTRETRKVLLQCSPQRELVREAIAVPTLTYANAVTAISRLMGRRGKKRRRAWKWRAQLEGSNYRT